MNTLSRLTYRREFLSIARCLRLTRPLRKLYHRWVVSPDGVYRTDILGNACLFYADTPQAIRVIESEFVRETRFHSALAFVLRPGDTYFDIGSNVGEFVVPIGKLVGPRGCVVAFEPQSLANGRLERNIVLNGLQNVRAFKAALGSANRTGTLSMEGVSSPSLLAKVNGAAAIPATRQEDASASARYPERAGQSLDEEVQVFSGDWFRTNQSLPLPRAVKIDVEGYEGEVLRGLRETLSAPECKLVCCEIHPHLLPKGATVQSIVEFVEEAGFKHTDVKARPSSHTTQVHLIARKGDEN